MLKKMERPNKIYFQNSANEPESFYEKAYDKDAEQRYWMNKIDIDKEKHQGKLRTIRARYDHNIRIKYSGYNRTYRSHRGYRRDYSPRMYSSRACP